MFNQLKKDGRKQNAKFEILLNTDTFHYFVSETKHWKDCFKSSNNKLEKNFQKFWYKASDFKSSE